MVRWFIRLIATMAVTLGILAPQGAGLAALAGLANGHVLVICTGDGLRTLRIGPDGQPADVSEKAEFCALSQAAGTASAAAPAAAMSRLVHLSMPALSSPPRHVPSPRRPSLPRAPPAV